MNSQLYLYQSRRLSRIIKALFNIKCIYTDYSSWEYTLKSNLSLYITYENGWNDKRFNVIDRSKSTNLISTDSLKEIIKFLKEQA